MDKETANKFAKSFIQSETAALMISKATPAVIIHKGKNMLGSVKSFTEEDSEIVLCAHTSRHIEQVVIDSIMELSPRMIYTVDDNLEMAERQDVFRMIGDRLTIMTPEQTKLANAVIQERGIVEL